MTDAATFCATLVDEWVRCGLSDVVLCPGSRSTPLALAVADAAERDDLRLHVHLDERSGAFMALGIGLASRRPPIVVTTSGTAAVNLHPAVVEADLSGVPLIVCTTDRPPEMRDRGAPQTIDQTHLYGRAVRWYHDPGLADTRGAASWRPLADRSWMAAIGGFGRPGPVQLNLPFAEPLTGSPAPLPSPGDRDAERESAIATGGFESARGEPESLPEGWAGTRGVMIAGCSNADAGDLVALAGSLGWPLVADPRSGVDPSAAVTIVHADTILRHEPTAVRFAPEIVLRVGELPASRVLNEWVTASAAHETVVADRPIDPWQSVSELIVTDVGATISRWARSGTVGSGAASGWLEAWREADDHARGAVGALVDCDPLTEPAVARVVMDEAPAAVVLSSSMPIRDAEWYAGPRAGVSVFANRGANGIDGVTSTAAGVALTGPKTVAVVGDVAFLHDTNGLLGLGQRGVDLTIVVIHNDGGGIFSFLPQASELPTDRYELLFGTPHGVDPLALASAHGLEALEVSTRQELRESVRQDGTRVVVVRTDRVENADLHRRINEAVAAALD